MTSKIISTYVAAGYTLSSAFDGLTITSTGGIGGTGVTLHPGAYVDNYGKINATRGAGVTLLGSGLAYCAAGASITGVIGILGNGAGDIVFNYGVIRSTSVDAILTNQSCEVDNGGPFNLTASISGAIYIGGAGTIDNYGVIKGGLVSFSAGGTITNGRTGDPGASISGYGVTISSGAGTIDNYGLINAHEREAVTLAAGGVVVNGAATDRTATIEGGSGVEITGAGTVTNYGSIRGFQSDRFEYGVSMGGGGKLTNGSALDEVSLIEGYNGLGVRSSVGTVVNFGTIEGDGVAAFGVYLQFGGVLTNGGGDDHAALVEGGAGVIFGADGGAGTVHNFGTIRGAAGYGLHMTLGGVVTNGSQNNGAALIEGYDGVAASGGAAVANFGTILGVGDGGGSAVYLGSRVSVVNGDVNHTAALMEGFYGVSAGGATDTVTNFGTITGAAGVAVSMQKASDVLVVEARCAFVGAVYGGGGTLDLASGVGTLSGLAGGTVTVSGSMAATTFQEFGTVEIGTGARFSDKGAVTLAAGQTVETAGGTLTLSGAVKNGGVLAVVGGTLTVTGAVTGTGHAAVQGGTLHFAGAFNQNVTFTGTTGVLELGHSQAYAGSISGFSHTGKTSLDLADIIFGKSTKATYSGTTKSGVLTVTDGTHTAHIHLTGNYTGATFTVSTDGHGGTKVVDPQAGGRLPFIDAMAKMGAGGFGTSHAPAGEIWRAGAHALAGPRVQTA